LRIFDSTNSLKLNLYENTNTNTKTFLFFTVLFYKRLFYQAIIIDIDICKTIKNFRCLFAIFFRI